ncbi:hypothetical protein BOTBODRAFT_183201 [Botryobasidium botryosum FD-172 SS1]|uniref:Uncharacterized protein n=1 Tax=Botryobasidium botryosum (strain FD-172 SS1) TaxID=930990 RepID=A0A067N0E7_BOTB1|nr:hypothetical protein BOTBODRAFT_183201 [Botryobasidium botryosum FD-172 SS1]
MHDMDFMQLADAQPIAPTSLFPKVSATSAFAQEMWARYNTGEDILDMGQADLESNPDAAARKQLEDDAKEFGLWNTETLARELGSDGPEVLHKQALLDFEVEDRLAELLSDLNIDYDLDDLGMQEMGGTTTPTSDQDWYPYGSKIMFLLDVLDNLPRLRISGALMRVFLWILRECGVHGVPSLDRLRAAQKEVRKYGGIPTDKYTSPRGNMFFMNDPRVLCAQDYANPFVAPHIHHYPEIPKGAASEFWHGRKWRKTMRLDMLTPMWEARPYYYYYVNELAQLRSGELVIPIRWLRSEGKVCADVWRVVNVESKLKVLDTETVLIWASDLLHNYLELQEDKSICGFNESAIEAGHVQRMPNPLRTIAGNDPLYSSFIDYWGDDVSGNRTKAWNKHWNAYLSHRNLPRKLLQQEYHVHFLSTSQHATIPEQFKAFKEKIVSTHTDPIHTRDALTGRSIRVRMFLNTEPADNPMQSECSGHIGGQGCYNCRKCHVGGTKAEQEEGSFYEARFKAGTPRSGEETLKQLESQVKLACRGVAKAVQDQQTATGVKDNYTQYWIEELLKRAQGLRQADPTRSPEDIAKELEAWAEENKEDIYNPFLTMLGFDAARDTPVEILHTILLGILKYAWHMLFTSWNATQKETYGIRLQDTDMRGLSIQAIRANPDMFKLWQSIGELVPLVWQPEIDNSWVSDTKVAIANVLDIFALIDPSKITAKIKLHLLEHIIGDSIEFGPIVGSSTEVFESYNGVFRLCSIFSNRLAPSRDIAIKLGDQESMKQRLMGGWWMSSQSGEWAQCGAGIRDFLRQHPLLQSHLGWSPPEVLIPGTVKPMAADRKTRRRPERDWLATKASKALNASCCPHPPTLTLCKYVVATSGDKCDVGSWVFATSPINSKIAVGQIVEILTGNASDPPLVTLDVFEIRPRRHDIYGLPVLARRMNEQVYMVIPGDKIKFSINVQHGCRLAGCRATGRRRVMQERQETTQTQATIEHIYKLDDIYLINTTNPHNHHLLRKTLDRSVIAPVRLYPTDEERRAHHFACAARLKIAQQKRREAAKARRAAKKKEKEGAESAPPASKKRKVAKE